jgi:hypothetical protein
VDCSAASPIVPVSGLAVPPYRQRQVGGRVIGPVPSTPLSIVFNFTQINIILSRIIVNTFRMVSVSVLRRARPQVLGSGPAKAETPPRGGRGRAMSGWWPRWRVHLVRSPEAGTVAWWCHNVKWDAATKHHPVG